MRLEAQAVDEPLIGYDRIKDTPPAAGWLSAPVLQAASVIFSFLFIFWLHLDNDGLWYQGDSPRHAVNGLFWYDAIAARPASLPDFAVRYYARYPIINPVAYPPLFYIFEGLAFRAFGPSPHVAKALILGFGMMMGFYTMAWARRWLGPGAGWAGTLLAFVPGVMIWANTVTLNVPATALGLACLYHYRRWFDSGTLKELVTAACLGLAAVLTYYQGGIAIAICLVWGPLLRVTGGKVVRMRYLISAALLCGVLPALVAGTVAPVFLERHLPGIAILTKLETWTFYAASLPALLGWALLAAGLAGLALGMANVRWRKEVLLLASWVAVTILTFTLFPAKDGRYILILAPACVLAAATGLAACGRLFSSIRPGWRAGLVLAGLAAGIWSATLLRMPQKSGFRAVASYVRTQAPGDAVLYDGYHDGLFGFYFRAFDPHYNRRLVLGQQLLYHYGPGASFDWVETLKARSAPDVANILRSECGCRLVAIEVGASSEWAQGQRLLRQAVSGPDFELVRSFPVVAPNAQRVDLYRLRGPIQPVSTVNVRIQSLSNRTFSGVAPIAWPL